MEGPKKKVENKTVPNKIPFKKSRILDDYRYTRILKSNVEWIKPDVI